MIVRCIFQINRNVRPYTSLLNRINIVGGSVSKCNYTVAGKTAKKFVRSNEKKSETKNSFANKKRVLIQKNDPNLFGASSPTVNEEVPQDDGDIVEEEHFKNIPLRRDQLPLKEYVKMIETQIKNKCLKEAIDVLEVRMQTDRVKPDYYIFELLIIECGRMGYSKKAFQLYNKMKQRDLKVTKPIYAALFNSCAKTLHPVDGLEQAKNLRKIMIQKGVEPNEIIMNTMINAFGRCGDIETAFELVDEMKEKKLRLEVHTMNHLLQACCSDKEYGFRHALLVWHKIYQRNMNPDIFSFNTMLRCVRDCGMGDLETMRNVLTMIFSASQQRLKIKASKQAQTLFIDDKPSTTVADSVDKVKTEDRMPNLLAKLPHLGSLVKMNEVKTSEDRLLLLGGLSGFTKEMELLKIRPQVKTFSQLLDCVPQTREAEHELIEKMREVRVRADTDFFNLLMKRRILRGDDAGAKLVLEMMKKVSLCPDIVTYGVMALGCRTREQAHEFFDLLTEKRIRANGPILGALFKNVRYTQDDELAADILKRAIDDDVVANEAMQKMAAKYKKIRHDFLLEHTNENDEQRQKYDRFYKMYVKWQKKMGFHKLSAAEIIKKVHPHPWKQFKENQPDGVEGLKNTKLRNLWKKQHGLEKLNSTRIKRMEENVQNDKIDCPNDKPMSKVPDE